MKMKKNKNYICIHGHFYQPPRENPWLNVIELQESASPYRDWNERINKECYSANAESPIQNDQQQTLKMINNYALINFNFGPTLLSWIEKYDAYTYARILEADKISLAQFSGHGSAIAQAYNHIIMPLANRRDKITQITWGKRDFEFRFKRKPEGMWLPETAVDIETLELMVDQGIKYVILAPKQARMIKPATSNRWREVNESEIDTQKPYLCRLPSGADISIFFYDGGLSNAIAFAGVLENGERFIHEIMATFKKKALSPRITHIAVDGETFGHHHKFGNMALSYFIDHFGKGQDAQLINYAAYLHKFPPTCEIKIKENTAWSSEIGVERWRSDKGGCLHYKEGWNQQWRMGLRESLDWLRDRLIKVYEEEVGKMTAYPWELRDDYISILLDGSEKSINEFFDDHQLAQLSIEQRRKLMVLLDIQKNAMLMFTSCGWFFDDVSGLETRQILQYAAYALHLLEENFKISLEEPFLDILETAKSNIPEMKNGRKVYEVYIRPMVLAGR